ncbi:MAG TPA: RNase adapter RapZ [Epulopiscium sp.]|nr:RNase adapter RapZ [Candidatus Epulonipiscium sp.]
MQLIIVTGMSGAGKSTAIRALEDDGFYCIDNLPPALIPTFTELCLGQQDKFSKVALGIDIRGGELFTELFLSLDTIKTNGYNYDILFLDSSDEILMKRFKETRRTHPLVREGRLGEGIAKERVLLEELKQKSSEIIDTSNLLPKEVREIVRKIYVQDEDFNNLMITVVTFGFKYGIPMDSDLVFDVRFMPNPYYIPEIRPLTGNDQIVQDYVMENQVSIDFLGKLEDMIGFLIPNYVKEGKNQLVISIGCTGGKHRSVTIGNKLFENLVKMGHSAYIQHRDIEKDKKRGK